MRYGLLMSPQALEKIEHEKTINSPSLVSPLFAGSLPTCNGMEVVTHRCMPDDRAIKIPHDLVKKFRHDKDSLDQFVQDLVEQREYDLYADSVS